MVEQATKEEAAQSNVHGGESADKKGCKGARLSRRKIPRIATWTRKVKVNQNYLAELTFVSQETVWTCT